MALENMHKRAARARKMAEHTAGANESYCNGIYEGYCKGSRGMIDKASRAFTATLSNNTLTAHLSRGEVKRLKLAFVSALMADFEP